MLLAVDFIEACAIAFLLYVVNKLCDHVNRTDQVLRERGIKR